MYVTQAGDWNAYRQKLASATAQAKASPDSAPQSAAGKVTARVEDKPSAADQAKDQVKVSRTEMPAKGVPGGKAAVGEEELIAKDRALKEAQDRLAGGHNLHHLTTTSSATMTIPVFPAR